MGRTTHGRVNGVTGNAGLRGDLGQGEHAGVAEPLPAAARWQSSRMFR
jgi:hypothetical protein